METNNLSTTYRKDPPYLVSYDWTDIDGTGMITFYLCETETDSGSDYFLTQNSSLYSYNVDLKTTGAGSPKSDVDFDLTEFQLPQKLEGTGYANIAMGCTDATGGTVYVICRLRKWDGASETTLVSVQSGTYTIPAAAGAAYNPIFSVPLVIPETHFAKGDILRLTVETYPDGADTVVCIGHDPANRTYSTGGGNVTISRSTVSIPFKRT